MGLHKAPSRPAPSAACGRCQQLLPGVVAVMREWLGPPLQVLCTRRMLESNWWLLMCCMGWRLGLRLRVLLLQTVTRSAGA